MSHVVIGNRSIFHSNDAFVGSSDGRVLIDAGILTTLQGFGFDALYELSDPYPLVVCSGIRGEGGLGLPMPLHVSASYPCVDHRFSIACDGQHCLKPDNLPVEFRKHRCGCDNATCSPFFFACRGWCGVCGWLLVNCSCALLMLVEWAGIGRKRTTRRLLSDQLSRVDGQAWRSARVESEVVPNLEPEGLELWSAVDGLAVIDGACINVRCVRARRRLYKCAMCPSEGVRLASLVAGEDVAAT
eukprot:796321-Rhodomonas_salina.2